MTSIRQRFRRATRLIRPHLPLLALIVAALCVVMLPTSVFATSIDANEVVSGALEEFIRPLFKIAQFGIAITAVILALIKAFQASRGQSNLWLQAGLLLLVAVIVTVPEVVAGIFSSDLEACVTFLKSGTGSCTLLN